MKRLGLLFLLFFSACASKSLQARMAHSERRGAEAEQALDQAQASLAALEPEAAHKQLEEARTALRDPDFAYYPERDQLRQRLTQLEKQLPVAQRQRAARDLQEKVASHQLEVQAAMEKLEALRPALTAVEPTEDALSQSQDALKDALDALHDGEALEPMSLSYLRYTIAARKKLERINDDVKRVEQRWVFQGGPLKAFQRAQRLMTEAKAEKQRDEKRERWEDAQGEFRTCSEEGAFLLSQHPALTQSRWTLAGVPRSAGSLVQQCKQQLSSLAKLLTPPRPKPAKRSAAPAARRQSTRHR